MNDGQKMPSNTMNSGSELAYKLMKNPYIFDLIELTEDFKEKELENLYNGVGNIEILGSLNIIILY